MRRRAGFAMILIGALLVTLGGFDTRASDAAEPPTAVFADEFRGKNFRGSTGTRGWSGSWVEGGESDGPTKGNVTVGPHHCALPFCLILESDDEQTFSARRAADLSDFAAATLTFSFRRDSDDDEGGAFIVQARAAGVNWVTLASYSFGASDAAPRWVAFDISDFVSSATEIRFLVSATNDEGGQVAIDNVSIEAIGEDIPVTTTTTTTTEPTTTTTEPTTTTTTEPTTTTTEPTTTTTDTQPTSRGATTTTTTGADAAGSGSPTTATTTTTLPPTADPDYATDKAVLVTPPDQVTRMVIEPVDAMAAHHHQPPSTPMVTFLNAAESVRSTGVYGAGVGIILAGFLLVGFEVRDENLHSADEKDEV